MARIEKLDETRIAAALKHLKAADARLARVIEAHGPCALTPRARALEYCAPAQG